VGSGRHPDGHNGLSFRAIYRWIDSLNER
jgi:hypothetical protein